MGKGSKRRPQQVSNAQFKRNWERAFPEKPKGQKEAKGKEI